MELREFVERSLAEIIQGVAAAQQEVSKGARSNGSINPKALMRGNELVSVQFDVAVTAVEGGAAGGGISVLGGIVSIGGQAKSETRAESISRIKFDVPVWLPIDRQNEVSV